MELARDWKRRFGGGPWDQATLAGIRGHLASCVPLIRAVFDSNARECRWLQKRFRRYDATTALYRERYRAADLKTAMASRTERMADYATFLIHSLLVSEAERESYAGVIEGIYLLQLDEEPGEPFEATVARLHEGARLCDAAAERLPKAAMELRRRSHLLRSFASERAAFALLGRRADPDEVAHHFEEAAIEATLADRVKPYGGDTHPGYLAFWAASMRCRAAERAGDSFAARLHWNEAFELQASFAEPSTLFRRAGLWSSLSDFEHESLVLDAIDALREGDAGLPAAVLHLRSWLQGIESDATVAAARMQSARLRVLAVEVLAAAAAGRRAPGLILQGRAAIETAAVLEQSSLDLFDRACDAHGSAPASDDLATAVLGLIAPDYAVSRLSHDVFRHLPPWYAQLYAQAQPHAECSWLLTLWYLRIVADYLYSVYEDRFAELPVEESVPPRPDLVLASLPELATLLQGLLRALDWDGPSNRALEQVVVFTEMALCETDEETVLGHLLATVRATQATLYPTPVRVADRAPSGEVALTAYIGEIHEKAVRGPHDRLPDAGFFYLKAREKEYSIVERRDGRPLHVYAARAFGIPQETVLLCEGVTDSKALEAILDARERCWRQLKVRIEVAGGADALVRRAEQIRRAGGAVVAVVDADTERQTGRCWDKLWESCQTAVVKPDLERVSYQALTLAIREVSDVEVSVTELRRLDKEAQRGRRGFDSVLADYLRLGASVKGVALGEALGKAFVGLGVPNALDGAVSAALRLASGTDVQCINSAHVHTDVVDVSGGSGQLTAETTSVIA